MLSQEHEWKFLSNHAAVLLCIAQEPGLRVRDVAERVGITPRAVLRILGDLEEAGYLSRVREGRRNRYEVYSGRPFRHPVAAHREVSLLLDLIVGDGRTDNSEPGEMARPAGPERPVREISPSKPGIDSGMV